MFWEFDTVLTFNPSYFVGCTTSLKFSYKHFSPLSALAYPVSKSPKRRKYFKFVLVNDETKEKLEQCKKALDSTTSEVVRQVYDELEK